MSTGSRLFPIDDKAALPLLQQEQQHQDKGTHTLTDHDLEQSSNGPILSNTDTRVQTKSSNLDYQLSSWNVRFKIIVMLTLMALVLASVVVTILIVIKTRKNSKNPRSQNGVYEPENQDARTPIPTHQNTPDPISLMLSEFMQDILRKCASGEQIIFSSVPSQVLQQAGLVLKSLGYADDELSDCSAQSLAILSMAELFELSFSRYILSTLFFSTKGTHWSNTQQYWITDDSSICEWYGVTCTNNKVTSLDLSSNNLTGTIPAVLFKLPTLEHINLGSNTLFGTLPSQLGSVSSLVSLDLSKNLLTGKIPDLIHLSSLATLHLENTSLTGSLENTCSSLEGKSLDFHVNLTNVECTCCFWF